MQTTSLQAYDKIQPHINNNQEQILNLFYENPYTDFTNMEIAYNLKWSINRITPRVLELRKLGLLTESRKRPCTVTKNNAIAWRPP